MGRWTEFSFVNKNDLTIQNLSRITEIIDKHMENDPGFCEPLFDTDADSHKWYEWKKDMKTLSSELPNIYFHIRGFGENHSDVWEAHVFNGKIQICQATLIMPQINVKTFMESGDCSITGSVIL